MIKFTKAFHIKDAYIVNGEGIKVPVRFTIISKLDDDVVRYKASFCPAVETHTVDSSGNERLLRTPRLKQFSKKEGVHYAKLAPEWSFPLSTVESHTHSDITNAIIDDMVDHHFDELPRNVQRWFSGDNFGSDLHEMYETKQLFESVLADVMMMLESED